MRTFGLTDTGVKREKNEDSILLDNDLQLYIVADGMGGHMLGDVASQTAVKVVHDFIEERLLNAKEAILKDDVYLKGLMNEAVIVANREILEYSRKQSGHDIMGTTISALLIRDKKMYSAHVGDSRIYCTRKGVIEKLTKDHNKAQELVDAGLLKEEEAENHRSSHILTRALGSSDSVRVDINMHDIQTGDSYLLSTDGLFRVLTINDVKVVLLDSNKTPEEKCRILIEQTLEGGAPDNVSLIILEPEKKGIFERIFS